MYRAIKNFIRNIYYGIENIIIWTPILWKDRDWDYTFLLYIMQHKLKLMSNYHRDYGICENSRNISDEIFECYCILNRITKDEYLDSYLKEIESRYGQSTLTITEIDNNDSSVKVTFIKDNGCERTAEEDLAIVNAFKMAEKELLEETNTFFNILSKNMYKWRD